MNTPDKFIIECTEVITRMKRKKKIKFSPEKKREIMLAINLELFEQHIISFDTYEATNRRIMAA